MTQTPVGSDSTVDEGELVDSFALLALRAAVALRGGQALVVVRRKLEQDGLNQRQLDVVLGAGIAYWQEHAPVRGWTSLMAGLVIAAVAAGVTYAQYQAAVDEAARDGSATYWAFGGAVLAGGILAFKGLLQVSEDISANRQARREMRAVLERSQDLVPAIRSVVERIVAARPPSSS